MITRTLAENAELAKTVTVLFPDDVCDLDSWNRFGDCGASISSRVPGGRKQLCTPTGVAIRGKLQVARALKAEPQTGKTRHHGPQSSLLSGRALGKLNDARTLETEIFNRRLRPTPLEGAPDSDLDGAKASTEAQEPLVSILSRRLTRRNGLADTLRSDGCANLATEGDYRQSMTVPPTQTLASC